MMSNEMVSGNGTGSGTTPSAAKKRPPIWLFIVLGSVVLLAVAAVAVVFLLGTNNAQGKITAAEKYIEEKEYDKAIDAYKAAIKMDDTNVDAYTGLAKLYIELAKDSFDEYETLIEKGKESKAEETYNDAINYYELALEVVGDAAECVDESDIKKIDRLREKIEGYIADAEEAHNGGGDTATASSSSTSTGETTTTDQGNVTIDIYRCTYNIDTVDSTQVQKVENAINEALAQRGATVRINISDIACGNYGQTVYSAVTSGECDLFWTASWWDSSIGTNDLYAYGNVYDLSDILPGTVLETAMDEDIWTASQYDKKDYFVPVYKECYDGYDLKVNALYADRYGWDFDSVIGNSTIETLMNLEPMLEQAKNAGVLYPYTSQGVCLFKNYYIDKYDFFTDTELFAVDRASNTVMNPIMTDDYKEFCLLMSSWVEKGYMSTDDYYAGTSYATRTTDWAFSWWTCVPGDEENVQWYDGMSEYVIDGITGKYMTSKSTLGSCYAVNSRCTEAEAEAAVEFLGYLYTDTEIADLYTYGILGEDYTLNNGLVMQYSNNYNHSAWESTSVLAITPIDTKGYDWANDYFVKNGMADASCAAGFRYDISLVSNEYYSCMWVLDDYAQEFNNGMVTAENWDSYLASYQADLDAAGYQLVLREFQRQYNEWLSID